MSVAANSIAYFDRRAMAQYRLSDAVKGVNPWWLIALPACAITFVVTVMMVKMGGGPIDNGTLSRAVHVRGGEQLYGAFQTLAIIGGSRVLPVLTLLIGGAFSVRRRFKNAAWLLVAVGGIGLLDSEMKLLVERPNPHFFGGAASAAGSSFPSNHAASALVLLSTLVCIAWPRLQRRSVRTATCVLIAGLVLIVGWSRIALGVHYPVDVIGGYALGGAWLALVGAAFTWRPAALGRVPFGAKVGQGSRQRSKPLPV